MDRGGFGAFEENSVMHTKLVWSFIALSWPTSDGDSLHVDGFVESAAGVKEIQQAGVGPASSFRMSRDEFTQFMAQRKEQVLRRKGMAADCGSSVSATVLQEKLASALVPVETGYSHPDKRHAFENCRIACLIFLNLVLGDCGEDAQAMDRYFADLARLIQDQEDDSVMTAEHLLWTLLSTTTFDEHYEICWKLSRMVGIVKRAGVAAWAKIEVMLRLFLGLGYRGYEAEARDLLRSWEGRAFVEELISEDREPTNDHSCSSDCRLCRLKLPDTRYIDPLDLYMRR